MYSEPSTTQAICQSATFGPWRFIVGEVVLGLHVNVPIGRKITVVSNAPANVNRLAIFGEAFGK
jgi:hypothetical protein